MLDINKYHSGSTVHYIFGDKYVYFIGSDSIIEGGNNKKLIELGYKT